MKRLICTILVSLFVLLSGCATAKPGGTGQPEATPTPATTATATPSATATPPVQTGSIDAIKRLLPSETGFVWQYSGFAEYALKMELTGIDESGRILTYRCEGEVADMSGGESKDDFNVKITYQVQSGVLKQTLQGSKALDNVFPNLELIREPLDKGAKWSQTVKDADGKEAILDCTIDDIRQVNGKTTYFLTYRSNSGGYYEKREITDGMGVTAFDRLYQFEDSSELIGYRLYLPDEQAQATGWEQWLPRLEQEYTYFGLAEYGHKGTLRQVKASSTETVLEYQGVYHDGTGKDDRFVVRYHADPSRGTVTEEVIANERGKKEINSKLHNLVILKFPLHQGDQWSHAAKLDGKAVTVRAVITKYDEDAGVVHVRYTAKNAPGYYNNTYFEERTFEKGYGMTGFGNLIPGKISLSNQDAEDPKKVEEAIVQHMFGYSLNKQS